MIRLLRQYLHLVIAIPSIVMLFPSSTFAGRLADQNTVYIVPNPYLGFGVAQRYENTPQGSLWIRDMNIHLNVSPSIELGIDIPYINGRLNNKPDTDRVGDVIVYLNYASRTFKDYLALNYLFGFNFGTGKDFRDPSTHPLESYGHEELRIAILGMKNWDKWTFNFELGYYFRTKNQKEDMFRGFAINPFDGDTWKRWFGFNPNRKENFFYSEKLKNDNLVYRIGLSQYYTYPFTIFSYFDLRHDFYTDEDFGDVETVRSVGVFSAPLWFTLGTKWFTDEETVHVVLFSRVAINNSARRYSNFSFGIGGYLEF